jgi:hypothetical protein
LKSVPVCICAQLLIPEKCSGVYLCPKYILHKAEHFSKCTGLYFCLYFIDTGTLLKMFRFVFLLIFYWYRNTFFNTFFKVFWYVFCLYFIDTATLLKVFRFVFLAIFYWYRNTFQSVPVCIFTYILLVPEHFKKCSGLYFCLYFIDTGTL